MCKLCDIRKKMISSQEKHTAASRRYAIAIQQYALAVDEGDNKEAEKLRVDIHTLLDVQLDALAEMGQHTRDFKAQAEEYNRNPRRGYEH